MIKSLRGEGEEELNPVHPLRCPCKNLAPIGFNYFYLRNFTEHGKRFPTIEVYLLLFRNQHTFSLSIIAYIISSITFNILTSIR